jgi:hypothetical protein
MDPFEDRAATPSYEPIALAVIFAAQPARGIFSMVELYAVMPTKV